MASLKDKDSTVKIEVNDSLLIPRKGDSMVSNAWLIAFGGAILTFVGLLVFQPDPYHRIFFDYALSGIGNTFFITVLSILLALVIGLIAGLGQISRFKPLNIFATVYVEIIRGIPLVVQLFYIYFVLGKFLKLDGIPAAVIALGFCYGAYMGEVIRAGFQSIPKGQMEAALALGMTRGQAIRKIILPQTFKLILPPIGNEFIALLKDSSLVSIVAIPDLFRRGREYASESFEYFETYTLVALIYLVITLGLSFLVSRMEGVLKKNER